MGGGLGEGLEVARQRPRDERDERVDVDLLEGAVADAVLLDRTLDVERR